MDSFNIPKNVPDDKTVCGRPISQMEEEVLDPVRLDALIDERLSQFPGMTAEKLSAQKEELYGYLDQQARLGGSPMDKAEHAFRLFEPIGLKQLEVSRHVLPKLCKETVPRFIETKFSEVISTLESLQSDDPDLQKAIDTLKLEKQKITDRLEAVTAERCTASFKA